MRTWHRGVSHRTAEPTIHRRPVWLLVMPVLASASLSTPMFGPMALQGQGIDAAAAHVRDQRRVAGHIRTLRLGAVRLGVPVDFSNSAKLARSLGDVLRAGITDPASLEAVQKIAAERLGATLTEAGRDLSCMKGWEVAGSWDLVPCYRTIREVVDEAARIVGLAVQFAEDARVSADGCGEPCDVRGRIDVEGVIPLFSVGGQLTRVEHDGDLAWVLGPTVSTNLPNGVFAALLGDLVSEAPIVDYLENRISLDLAFFAGDSLSQVLTGASVGLLDVELSRDLEASLSGFVRSVPESALDSLFIQRSRELDEDNRHHSTFGFRLTLFPSSGRGWAGALGRRTYIALEYSGVWVAPGTGLTLLKNVLTAQDPELRRSHDQWAIGVGFWFYGASPGD